MLGVILAILVICFAGWVILKKYKPQLILFFSGIILLACAIIFNTGPILKGKAVTGFIWFDIFELIKQTFSTQIADIGLIILVVAAFASYMEHVGASGALVSITTKPLKMLKSPYLVLAMAYVIGQHINIVVPSAAGLGLLMMATLYPSLIKLGIHPLAACSVMATTPCLDLGPASGMSNYAGKMGGMDGALYFADYQLKIMWPVIAVIAILHFVTQWYFDKKEGTLAVMPSLDEHKFEEKAELKAPLYYAILPIIPLALVFIFSPIVYVKIKMNIITACFITIFLTVILEIIRARDAKKAYDGFNFYLKQMGSAMDVVTIMVAASTFAAGLHAIGAINTLITFGKSAGFGLTGMTIIMVAIISLAAGLTGSGNAAFLSFAALAPEIAKGMGFHPILLLMPMQLAAGVARSMSPVSGVVIACAGLAEQSPMQVAKRTFIPMLGGLFALVFFTLVMF